MKAFKKNVIYVAVFCTLFLMQLWPIQLSSQTTFLMMIEGDVDVDTYNSYQSNSKSSFSFLPFFLAEQLDTKFQRRQQQQKEPSVAQRWQNAIPPGEPLRITLMHVGKAGGSGLKETLGMQREDLYTFRLNCWLEGKKKNLSSLGVKEHSRAETDSTTNVNGKQLQSLDQAWSQVNCTNQIFQHAPNRSLLPFSRHLFAECHVGLCRHEEFLPDTTTFLFPVRRPIARLVSAFNFWRELQYNPNGDERRVKTKRKKTMAEDAWVNHTFGRCFDSIQHAAETLLDLGLTPESDLPLADASPSNMACQKLAQNLFLGRTPILKFFEHFWFGYRFYKDLADQGSNVPIVVTRQEQQLHDLHTLDKALGGQGNFTAVYQTHGSEAYKVKSRIESVEGRHVFCCLIWQDIQAYQEIVLQAVNLNSTEKKQALQGAFEECSVSYNPHGDDNSEFLFSWANWHNTSCSKYYHKRSATPKRKGK